MNSSSPSSQEIFPQLKEYWKTEQVVKLQAAFCTPVISSWTLTHNLSKKNPQNQTKNPTHKLSKQRKDFVRSPPGQPWPQQQKNSVLFLQQFTYSHCANSGHVLPSWKKLDPNRLILRVHLKMAS